MMEEDDDIDSLSLDDDEEDDQRTNNNNNNNNKKKKNRSKNKNNKRRFSDEQVKSLETIFESETKLEPRKKVEVARELGLQPRQVAIWFQNKRARWKSKQIEKNYRILKSNYDNLKARLEVIRRDKESLITQVQELRRLVDKSHHDEKTERKELMTGNNDSRDNREKDDEELVVLQDGQMVYSDEDNNKSGNNNNMSSVYLGESEQLILNNMTENIDNNGSLSSIISPVNKWCSFDVAGNLFDHASSNSHWWESWT